MIYLDNAATSFPKAPNVAQTVYHYLISSCANAGRSSYTTAQNASIILFETRELLAELFNIKKSEQILFTANATQALNTVIFGLAKHGDKILTSSMEHNSVMRPLRHLEKTKQVKLEFFNCDNFGFPDITDYIKKLQTKPKFVITTGCSNVTGAIFPFLEMAELAHRYGIVFCLDAAQLAGDYSISLGDSSIDMMCFSGHKGLLAPSGTGGFYLRESVELPSLLFGGTGSASDLDTQPDFLPDKFESGTLNLAGIVGLKSSLQFILKETIKKIFNKRQTMYSYFYEKIDDLQAFEILSPLHNQIGILSVIPKFCTLADFTQALNMQDIAVRTGLHCSPQAHRTIGSFTQGGAVRFSLGYFTEKQDLDIVLTAIKEMINHA
jgi:cysteine desulfurase family protein